MISRSQFIDRYGHEPPRPQPATCGACGSGRVRIEDANYVDGVVETPRAAVCDDCGARTNLP